MLLVIAALIRSIGGTEERFPFSLAVLAPLGALAVVSRFSPDESIQLWIAMVAIGVVLVRSLLYIPRRSSLALAITAAGLLAPPEAQAVAWASLAAVLIATIGLSQVGGSRIAWFAVAIVPFAFLSAASDPALLVIVTFATIVLAIVLALAASWQPSLASQPGGWGRDCAAYRRGNLGLPGRWMAAESSGGVVGLGRAGCGLCRRSRMAHAL